MALFGDRADFAIEAELEPGAHGAVWGRMCVWCGGIALGNINERFCALYPAYCSFQWLAANYETLWARELAALDDLDRLNFLDERIYGYHGSVKVVDSFARNDDLLDRQWNRFDFLTNWGEQFDDYKSFLICPPGQRVKVLSHDFPESVRPGVSVSRNGFELAIRAFTNWFESQSIRLGIPCERDSSPE